MLSAYVVTLMVASAGERIIFKVTVDGMAPFRAILLLLILFTSIIAFACIAIVKRLIHVSNSSLPLSAPSVCSLLPPLLICS
jgi:hypothetical protein